MKSPPFRSGAERPSNFPKVTGAEAEVKRRQRAPKPLLSTMNQLEKNAKKVDIKVTVLVPGGKEHRETTLFTLCMKLHIENYFPIY